MSNVNTGFWSALGAVLGGAAGAVAGKYAAEYRPISRHGGGRPRGRELEDAMVIGGATGAVVGAFVFGTAAADDPQPAQLQAKR